MVICVEIINNPLSGVYQEVIYDIKSSWRSENWGFVKFTNDDYMEWCGQFRGTGLGVELSERYNNILILTTDAIYLLDRLTNKLIEIYEDTEFTQLTLSPYGDYILASSYEIVIVTDSLKKPTEIEIGSGVCSIELKKWEGNYLTINCEDYVENGDFSTISLDAKTYEII